MNARDNITLVTGYSDDLIEFDGAISDEASANWGAATIVAFPSIDAEISVNYDDDGIWRIAVLRGDVKATRCEDREGYTGPDGPVYSDLAEVRATDWEIR